MGVQEIVAGFIAGDLYQRAVFMAILMMALRVKVVGATVDFSILNLP